MENLTNSDKQVLQSALNSRVHQLKLKRADLGTEHCRGILCEKKYESGRRKITANINQIHSIKEKLGVNKGFSQQPGSPDRDEPVPQGYLPLRLDSDHAQGSDVLDGMYYFDGHALPYIFAMVYLMDKRRFASPEAAEDYLMDLMNAAPEPKSNDCGIDIDILIWEGEGGLCS